MEGSGTYNTQTSKVSGVVQIDGAPAKRIVRAFSYNSVSHLIEGQAVLASKSLGQASSDANTGAYAIDLLDGYGNDVFVVAFDDYGGSFIGEDSLDVGDRVHPTTPNGHVFECVSSGTLPEEEPVWVIDTETSQLYGTASMIARPFYRPMVHGPVAPEVTEGSNLWTPALITNLVWLDSSDSSTLTTDVDGRVSGWADKSGNELDFTQTLEARQPYYQDGVFFSEDYLSREDLANIKFVMLVVNRVDLSPSQNYPKVLPLLGQEGTSQHHLFMQVDSAYDFSIDGSGGYSGDIYLNGEDPVAGTNIELGLSDDSMFETNLYAIEWDETQEFGTIGRFATPSDAYYLTGAVLEVLMFTETPSSQQMKTLEGYLAHKWDMAGKLPAGHPYKAAAPVISPAWTPANLFLDEDEGVWFDPSDLSSMFQDSGGDVPVSADGDPVGLIRDKSGNGLHAIQVTDVNRPIYRTNGTHHWLEGGDQLRLIVPGSASTMAYLHDGSGVFVAVAASMGDSYNPGATYGLVGTNGGSSSNRGMEIRYDDRSGASRNDALGAQIANGIQGQNPYGPSIQSALPALEPAVIELSHASTFIPQAFLVVDGVVIDSGNYSYSPSGGASEFDLELLGNGSGSFNMRGKFFGAFIINRRMEGDALADLRAFMINASGAPSE